ncbi:hypothetical protein [Oceaniglobus trochenteri]|uniref:hypothetical protein n=1 Tax=Oceaniglobus trochenteri TaxID=2763260 RepID=UPI001CFF949C|nr:hypothetical protein [Oceaniglobus trochenteri]
MSIPRQSAFLNSALRSGKSPVELATHLSIHATQLDLDALLELNAALIMELCAREAMERQRIADARAGSHVA